MKITFYSNYLTHHQIPFCNAMYEKFKNDFCFVSTEPMDDERIKGGWRISEKYQYELKAYESDSNYYSAMELARDSDAIIIGSAPEIYVKERMKSNKKLTLRYSERIYKNGRWRALSPRGMFQCYRKYFRYINNPLYMLCASAYTSYDLALTRTYIDRCFKWGYFPRTYTYDIGKLMIQKVPSTILWVGRLIEWKHPEATIYLAKRLKETGISFSMNIIGLGYMENELERMIDYYCLQDYVHMLGQLEPNAVREYMEKSSIFITTSDFMEGWGAVVNEAMNNGCAVIASHAMGAVPFLIEDGIDGMIYTNGDLNQLYEIVCDLLMNSEKNKSISIKAYKKITNMWNAENASERLISLISHLLIGEVNPDIYESGPCSKARIIENNWRQ